MCSCLRHMLVIHWQGDKSRRQEIYFTYKIAVISWTPSVRKANSFNLMLAGHAARMPFGIRPYVFEPFSDLIHGDWMPSEGSYQW